MQVEILRTMDLESIFKTGKIRPDAYISESRLEALSDLDLGSFIIFFPVNPFIAGVANMHRCKT